MNQTKATVIGFLVAPIIPALMFGILTPITEHPTLVSILGLMPIGYFFSMLATIFLGIPGFLLLKYAGLIRWWSATFGGFVAGAGIGITLQWPTFSYNFLILGFTGALSAFVFWMIWKQGQKPINTIDNKVKE